MQALDEKKTNGRWKVAYVDPQQVCQSQHNFIMRDHLRKEIKEKAKTPEEEEKLIQGYHKAKLHEVSTYIANVMRKNQHKDSIKFAYNFE